tara:strand:+ start:197 stop:883 length:687 start_codon:yes stop_codon:yes gene_type:complete
LKNILIIGGSSGVGDAITKKLSTHNKIISTYRNNFKENSNNIEYKKFDVIENTPDELEIDTPLNSIIYCPGTINLKPVHRYSEQELLNDFRINVTGFIKLFSFFKKNLQNSENASVILFSSVAAQKGISFHTQVACSKGAIESLTRTLAAELAPKIRVNAIAPSLLDTPLSEKFLNTEKKIETNKERHPLKQIGDPEDVAKLVEFLINDHAKWITGQVINIDGGLSTL